MKEKQRPLSPFMIGPYYRPQLTSILSLTHRATGIFLSIVGAPLLLWWISAVSNGPEAYDAFLVFMGGWIGQLNLLACLFSLSFHSLNGVRHLIWDTGRALDLRSVYVTGWVVLAGTVVSTAILMGLLL
ncbi:MAG: succinate dehydrogenase, cytochrome b556 subunit [Proteobacteria bacterium]|nr:succinate dehydrogenase, cytochrome b556 subunit [Pseudomonadota bacterium]MCH8057116.1 succinate dehydrogenase, cytochrome b556 subunit [Pseudomonadota bacterium]